MTQRDRIPPPPVVQKRITKQQSQQKIPMASWEQWKDQPVWLSGFKEKFPVIT